MYKEYCHSRCRLVYASTNLPAQPTLLAGINVYSAKFCIGILGISDKLPICINFIDW